MNMNKQILLALALAVTLTACGDSCKAYTDKVKATTDTPCGVNHMTNDEIIAETKLCEDAGLTASALHCGDDHKTTSIQCEPILRGKQDES